MVREFAKLAVKGLNCQMLTMGGPPRSCSYCFDKVLRRFTISVEGEPYLDLQLEQVVDDVMNTPFAELLSLPPPHSVSGELLKKRVVCLSYKSKLQDAKFSEEVVALLMPNQYDQERFYSCMKILRTGAAPELPLEWTALLMEITSMSPKLAQLLWPLLWALAYVRSEEASSDRGKAFLLCKAALWRKWSERGPEEVSALVKSTMQGREELSYEQTARMLAERQLAQCAREVTSADLEAHAAGRLSDAVVDRLVAIEGSEPTLSAEDRVRTCPTYAKEVPKRRMKLGAQREVVFLEIRTE
eukprot:g12455.t1